MKVLNVLIACEESQAECAAFRSLGHNAYSCDLQPAGLNPAWHILGDVRPYLNGMHDFITQDGKSHSVPEWDLIIAHPPCTYLCIMSACRMKVSGRIDWQRFANMIRGRRFFFECLNAQAKYVAVENPVPLKRAQLPQPSCYACPSWYGVKYSKKTCYWLRGLPPLMPTIVFPNPKCWIKSSRGKYRSRTFPELAKAIAQQWSSFILSEQMTG